ncbi:MAG: VWA domain-containing protein [Armatimonadota bacterium]
MMIRFSHPQYLLLLPLVWAYTWWVLRGSLAEFERGRRLLAGGIRLFLLTLAILALSGIQLIRPTTTLCTAFVVDVSDSISPAERDVVLDYIHRSAKAMRSGDSAALVAFGAEALLDHAPEDRDAIRKIYSIPSTSRTDIAAGIQLAMASFPQSSGKQIVLFTDGNENLGNAAEQAGLAETSDVRISVVPLERDISRGEALLLRADAPPEVRQGAPFQITVLAESLQETDGEMTLYRNNQPVERREVHLTAGKTALAFQQTAGPRGLYQYKVVLDVPAEGDTVPDNNIAAVSSQVSGKPTILLVEGVPGDGTYLARALRAHDVAVELAGVDRIPGSVEACALYDSVVFINVPAWVMSPYQMAVIRSAVHDTGMGFAMIGGEQSFGAGGYYRTPIEEALPVSMEMKKEKRYPSLTLVIVIDISGSMTAQENGVPKIRLAAEAAVAAIELLQPIDNVCVIGFDTGPVYVVRMTRADRKPALISQVRRLQAGGGGILANAALQEAYRVARGANTQIKHVILCPDAADTEAHEGCINIINQMRRDRITLSVIGFGRPTDPDVRFHQEMARAGGGTAYLAERVSNLPSFFTRDVLTAAKPLLIEKPFNVQPNDTTHPAMRNIAWGSAPPLLGYVGTSLKSAATSQLLLASPQDDPVLAAWPYGLGHTLAFTSDATAHWGAHWLSWEGYSSFWAQALRWTLRRSGRADFQTTLHEENGRVTIDVEAVTPEGEFRNLLNLRAHISHVEPGGIAGARSVGEELELTQTAPGHYQGQFDARRTGSYLVTVEEREGKESKGLQMAALAIPYSPEYQTLKPDLPLLERITEHARGELNPPAADVYGRLRFGSRTLQDLWPLLLTILAVLFLLDVAVRRILLPWTEVFTLAWQAVASRLPRRRLATAPAAPAHTETLGGLLTVRDKTRETQDGTPQKPITPEILPSTSQTPPPETPRPAEPAAPADTTPTATVGALLRKKKERNQ